MSLRTKEMKELKSEIRMWVAEKLLSWAFNVTPWNNEGQKMRKYIADYYSCELKNMTNDTKN